MTADLPPLPAPPKRFAAYGYVAFDGDGYQLQGVAGCPNCGKGRGWMDPIGFVARLNSGRDPNEPCSRVCAYQQEWADQLAARDRGEGWREDAHRIDARIKHLEDEGRARDAEAVGLALTRKHLAGLLGLPR